MRRILALLAVLAISACKEAPAPPTEPSPAPKRPSNVASCTRSGTGEQLKGLMFREAKLIRTANAAMLDPLSEASTVELGAVRVKSRDDALDATVCTTRLVIGLPEGVADPFNGSRALSADIEFAAQGSAASREVFVIAGGEPIIYRLAAMELREPRAVLAPAPAAAIKTVSAAPPPTPAAISVAAGFAEPRRTDQGRPSFDCRTARGRAERMICRDERLAAFDRVLAPLYSRALRRADREERARLRASQTRFERARDGCAGPGCIAQAYQDRMNEIDAIAAAR